jgi:hypothetical protein
MAKHKVAKDFDHSHDGVNVRRVKAGEEVEIHPDHVAGLIQEGFIHPEVASKLAGAAVKGANLSEVVNDTSAVDQKIATAEVGISDGHIGKPEADAIVDQHRVIDTLPAVGENIVEAEKPAHDKKHPAK